MKIKKILSGIISAAVISSIAGSVVSAEIIEEPNFPMHGNKCGKVIVETNIARDVNVKITQNTQDGDFDYYTVVIPQGTSEAYEFVLEGKDDVNYTIQLGVSKYKSSGNLQYYSDDFMVYDTDEINEQNVSGYEYSYTVFEGDELSDNTLVEDEKTEDNIIRNQKSVFFPVSDCIPGDVNMNGNVELQDIILIAKHMAKAITLNEDEMAAADYNGDGSVNLFDAIEIAKYIMKK